MGGGAAAACIAVGYGQQGSEEFIGGGYWKGPQQTGPFVDPEPDVSLHKLFGTGSLGASGLLSLSTMRAIVTGKAPSDTSTKGGNQWNLGGTFVVDVQTEKTVWEHRQKGFADHPSIDALLAACQEALAGT